MSHSVQVKSHGLCNRKKTRQIDVGGVLVGGDAPVSIQSMTNTDTANVDATVAQILALEELGCEIVRVAVPNAESAEAVAKIKQRISIPLITDIHFDWRLALASLKSGADCLRLNPGNIGSTERIAEVVSAAKGYGVPIRIGVNAGSLEKDILAKYGHPTAEALVESAMRHVRILEELNFDAIKVSLKASSVPLTIASYRKLSEQIDYPLHVGVTEAGTPFGGTIKSAVGIGAILAEGIGDTIRVSLTADPTEEIRVAWEILKSLGLRSRGVNLISCPTCGRTRFDSTVIALEIETALAHITEPIDVAVMGCVVNGPGEAMEADVGIAGGEGVGLIYVKGTVVRKVTEAEAVGAVVAEVERIVAERAK